MKIKKLPYDLEVSKKLRSTNETHKLKQKKAADGQETAT